MDRLPVYMVYLWTIINIGRPHDIFPVLKPLHPGDITAALSVGSYVLLADKESPVFSFPEFKLFVYLSAYALPCSIFGFYPGWSFEFLKGFVLKFGLYLFLLTKLVTKEEDIEGLIKTFVICGFMMAVAAVMTRRAGVRTGVGTAYDPNDLAMVLVTMLPIAAIQIMTDTNRRWKAFCIAQVVFSLVGIIATQSRGGFLGLVSSFIFALFTKVPGLPKGRLVTLTVFAGIVFALNVSTEYMERLGTITSDVSDLEAGSGRIMIWLRGLAIAKDHPILGVGPNCFSSAYGHYLEYGLFKGAIASYASSGKWQAPHNSFVQALVEMGLPGLLIFIAINARSFKNFRQLKDFYSEEGAHERLELRAASLEIALVGFLVCAFFLSQAYGSIAYVFCVLSGAMVRTVSTESAQNEK
jgi:O-antigen ligase